MDAKDSFSLSSYPATAVVPAVAAPVAGSKDGPPSDEGRVAATSPDAEELAKEAASLFQSRRFAECVTFLNQLFMIKPDDPKVCHNIAVAEYFRDGCSDPKKLIDLLNKVKEKSGELNASSDQIEVGISVGSNSSSGIKANSTIFQQFSGLITGRIVYADEFDTSVAVLNIAVILYQLHDYAHALSILQPIYQNIEPIDETAALHVCLLLLDVALACQDASKAADVIQYLEKSLNVGQAVNQVDNGSNIQHRLNQGAKLSTNNTSVPDASGSESSGSVNVPENSLSRTLSDETLEYETLYSTLDAGTQSSGRPTTNECSKLSTDQTTSVVDLKLNLHLYKVRFLLLTRNLKAAKREIKLAMNVARFSDSSSALLLKSQLEYARGNQRKAIKLLMASSNRTESGMLSMFNNNMGCIYHQLGKHHTASLFFSKALKSSTSLHSENPLKLSTFFQDKSLVIVYNCGLQYLVCGKPLVAVHCFNKARAIYYDRPILWLRFAECCLLALEKGLLRANGNSSNNELKVHVVGSGRWRHLVIDGISSTSRYRDCLEEDGFVTSDCQYRLSLPFARRCLLSALHLLSNADLTCNSDSVSSNDEEDSNQANPVKSSSHKNVFPSDSKASNATSSAAPANTNGDPKEIKGGVIANTTLQCSLSTYEDICRKENNLIKQAVLVDLAYVELSLGNPLKALSAAKAIQELSDCSKIYLFLSHVYAAEALCLLSRPKEAAEQLVFYVSENNEIQLPYNDDDREKWRMDKCSDVEELNGPPNAKTAMEDSQGIIFLNPEEARGSLYVNLATMYAIQGDIEKASQLVKEALSALPNHPKATLAAIYVDLLAGRKQDALVKLKESRHVRFLP